jgi:hypothetical protein
VCFVWRLVEAKLRQRRWSGSEKNPKTGEVAVNGEDEQHDISTEDSSSKAEKKKKKKGLKTPSFLKKKKDKKKTDS